jgi:putative endonuclease
MSEELNRRLLGAQGEDLAANYLRDKGYTIITRNYGVKFGEIDLIAESPAKEIVFVEVKWAKSERYGDPSWKISPAKIEKIKRVAEYYLLEHKISNRSIKIEAISIIDREITHFRETL